MTVLGVDGCKGGWVVVVADANGFRDVFVAKTIGGAEERGIEAYGASVMVVDMPIGLADGEPRVADAMVRAQLGPRRSSVFDVPVRAAVEAATAVAANEVSRTINGRGVGSMSYALGEKIREVDAFVKGARIEVREGHPEMSFCAMAGRPMAFYKKTLPGALARRAALQEFRLAPPMEAEVDLKGVAFDDLHDAAAMAWTALRVARGEAVSVPAVPEVFSDGWPSAIWY